MAPPVEIPAQAYFKIGEVAALVGVAPHVLRHWEQQLGGAVRPTRNQANQRVYRRRDVERFVELARLRYEEQFALPAARRRLRESEPAAPAAPAEGGKLDAAVAGLRSIMRMLDEDEAIP